MVSKPDVKSSSSDEEDDDSEEEYSEVDDDIESSKENSRKTPTTGNEESSSSEEEEDEEEEEEVEEEDDDDDDDDDDESSEEEEEDSDDEGPKKVVQDEVKQTNDPQVILEEDESTEEPVVAEVKEVKKILWTPQFSGSVKARVTDIETTQAVTSPALSRSNSRGSFSQSAKPGVSLIPAKPQPGMLQPNPAKSGRTSPVGEWFKAVAAKPYEPHLGFPRLCRSKTMPSVFGHSTFGSLHQDEDNSTGDSVDGAIVAHTKADNRPPWVSQRKIKQMVDSGTPWWARAKSIDAGERMTPIVPVRSVSMSRKASTPHVPWSVVPAKMADTNNSPFKAFSNAGSGASAFRPPVKQAVAQPPVSPKMASPKMASPKMASPKTASPKMATTKTASPKMSPKMTPKLTSPKTTPKLTSPKTTPKLTSPKMTPKLTSPKMTPKMDSPKITSPVIASPKLTSPVIGSPKIISPIIASPKLGSPKVASSEVAQLVETQIIHYPSATLPTFQKVPEVGTLSSQQHSPEAKAKARSVLVKKVPSSPPILPPNDALALSPGRKRETDSDESIKFSIKPVQQRVLLAEMESFSSSDLSSPDIGSPLQELKIPPPLSLDNLNGSAHKIEKHLVSNLAKEFEPPSHNIRNMAEGGETVSRLQKQFTRTQSFESPSLNKRQQQPSFNQKELKVPPPLSLDTLNGFQNSTKKDKTSTSGVARQDFLSKFAEPHKVEAPVLPFARDTHVTHGIVAARLQEHVKRASSPVDNFLNHPRDHGHHHAAAANKSPVSPHNAAGNSMVDSFFSKLSRSSSECLKIPSSGLQQRPPSPVRPTFDFFNGASGVGPKQQVRDFPGASHLGHQHTTTTTTINSHTEIKDTRSFPVIRKDNSSQEVPKSLNLHTLDSAGRLSPQSMRKDEKLAELRMRYPFINPQTLFEVNLVKNSRGLGICICGGNDPEADDGPTIPFIRIKNLYPLQPALECGKLHVGDIVLCVNKRHLTWLNHNEAVDALRVAPTNVCLTMCRPPPGILPPVPQHFEVVMEKWGGSLGFTLHKRDERHRHPGHFIKELVKDPALTDGRLQPGDELVKVNGTNIRAMSHAEAIQFLRTSPTTVTLSLRRDIEPSSSPVSPLSPMEPFPPPLSESPTVRGDKKILRKEAQDLLSDKSRRKNGDSSISPFGSPKSRRQRRRAGGHISPSDLSASPSTLSGDSTGDLNSTGDITSESIFSTASEGLGYGDMHHPLPTTSDNSTDSQLDAIKQRLFPQPSFGNPSPRGPSPAAPAATAKMPRPTSLDLANGVSDFQERLAVFGAARPKLSGSAVTAPALCVSKYDSSDTTTEETDSDGPAGRGGPMVALSGGGSPRFPFATEPPRMLPADFTRSPVASPRNSYRVGQPGQMGLTQPVRTSTPVAPCPLKRAASTLTAVEQMKQELFTVELERTADNNRLGFSLFAVNTASLKGSFVRAVHPGTIAYQDGRLRAGDELLKVNGIYVGHTPTDSIIELLRVQKGKIVLEVLRNPAITSAVLAEIK